MSQSPYSSKNVFTLVLIFLTILYLLYSLGSFLHESRKMSSEIEAIRQQNQDMENEKVELARRISYLKTPQRLDKEAKMQMGKKQPNEQVIVFIDDDLNILPSENPEPTKPTFSPQTPVWQKWRELLFGKSPVQTSGAEPTLTHTT